MADKQVSINIEGRYVVTSSGIEETRRKAQELAQTQDEVAEGAAGVGDAWTEAMNDAASAVEDAAKRIPDAMREAADAARRAANGDSGALLSSDAALSRATGMLSTLQANLAGGVDTPGEQRRLERDAAKARYYLDEAGTALGGQPNPRLDALNERLRALEEALDENRTSLEERAEKAAGQQGQVDPQRPRPPEDQQQPGMLQGILDELRRFAGAGLASMGPMGRLLGTLGPYALAIGGGVMAFNAASRYLTGANAAAREDAMGNADLARQYNYSYDPLMFFRDQQGEVQPWLLGLGYGAQDAAGAAARYDLPGGFRGDVRSILTLARTTGLEEGAITDTMRSLGLAGTYQRGDADSAARVLKHAVTEGIIDGVSGSDTIRSLTSTIESAFRQGQQVSGGAMAFNAALQQVFAGTGNRALQGQQGATAMSQYAGAVAGGDDFGMQMALFSSLGGQGFTAAELGLTGEAATGYESIRAASPVEAFLTHALPRLRAGNAGPEAMARLEQAFNGLVGTNPAFRSWAYKALGLEGDAALIANARGGTFYQGAADRTPEFTEGTEPIMDVQGANVLDFASRGIGVREHESELAKSYGVLNVAGGLEMLLRGGRVGLRNLITGLLNGVGGGVMQDGNLYAPYGTLNGAGVPGATAPAPAPLTDPTLARGYDDAMYYLGATAITTMPGEQHDAGTVAAGATSGAHKGIDFRIGAAGGGDDVYAPFAATVVATGYDDTYGNWVKLRDQNGEEWLMAHFAEASHLQAGQSIDFGSLIGTEGSTGLSNGAHLHMQLAGNDARNTDPLALAEALAAAGLAPEERQVNVAITLDVTGLTPDQEADMRDRITLDVDGTRVPANYQGQ